MTTMIALLRGVNIGGHHKIRMEELRALCESLGFGGARTFIQSGNVVFRSAEAAGAAALRLEEAIERTVGFRPRVAMRTADEWRGVVARNPFPDVEGSRLIVLFPVDEPDPAGWDAVRRLLPSPEEIRTGERELFLHFPTGMGQSKLKMTEVERALGVTGTARNWNTVVKLLAMAEELAA